MGLAGLFNKNKCEDVVFLLLQKDKRRPVLCASSIFFGLGKRMLELCPEWRAHSAKTMKGEERGNFKVKTNKVGKEGVLFSSKD